jgi:hypothetical protein
MSAHSCSTAHAGVSHTTFFDAIVHEASQIGIFTIQDWLIKRSSRAKNQMQDFLLLLSVTVSVSRAIKAAHTLLQYSFNPLSAGAKESEQCNPQAMYEHAQTCCQLSLFNQRIESDCISLGHSWHGIARPSK